MSYILNAAKEIVATTSNFIKSGTQVKFSSQTCEECINAARAYNLVNASTGIISNASKYARIAARQEYIPLAEEINENEFLVA